MKNGFNPRGPGKLFEDNLQEGKMEGGISELEKTSFYVVVLEGKNVEKFEILKNDKVVEDVGVYDAGSQSCRLR